MSKPKTNYWPCVFGYYYTSTIPTEAVTTTILIRKTCNKCGILKKSGKLSCCARGGDWFKNCGDVGGSNFDHTWVEGTQACTRFTSLSSVESPGLLMLHYERTNLNTTAKSSNDNHHHTEMYPVTGVSGTSTTANTEDCVELNQVFTCVSVLFISLHLYNTYI